MPLDLLESIARVEKSPELKAALSGAYLCSAITFLQPGKPVEYWDLNYYAPEKGDISHIHVLADSAEIKSTDKPLKKEEPKKIDTGKIKISIDDALKSAAEFQEKNQKSTVQKIFASLYSEGRIVWAINFILAGMKIFQVKLDAESGAIIESKLIDFLQKNISAS